MTTTKSYSKSDRFASAYVAALKAQFPFAIVSGIIFLILFVVAFFISTVVEYRPEHAAEFYRNCFRQGIYADMAQSIISLIALALLALPSIFVGLSYMHSKKMVDLYHSLPISRPKLLGANLLATLTAVLGPYLLMYLLTMIIQLITCGKYGCFGAEYFLFIVIDMLAAMVYIAVIIAFVAFVAVNVGTVFDAFAVTIALGFAPPLIYVLGGYIWQSLLYGASFNPSDNLVLLSPFMFVYKIYFYILNHNYAYSANLPAVWEYGSVTAVLLLGLLAAALLLVAAVVCYRRRGSEIAEQTQPRGILQIIVKLFAAFIGGSMFFAIFDNSDMTAGLTVKTALFSLLGVVCVGLIAEIVLSRGMKWLAKNFKWLLVAGAVYCLLLVGANADVFGYSARVPSLDSIESVQVAYVGRFGGSDGHPHQYDNNGTPLTDAESIAIVRETHNIAVNNRPPRDFRYTYSPDFGYNSISIKYRLKNGQTMSRTYGRPYIGANEKLVELENKSDFIRSKSALFWAEQNPGFAEVSTVELYASFGSRSGQHSNVLDEPELLLNAIRQDMLEQSLDDIINPSESAMGFIRVNFKPIDRAAYYLEHNIEYSYSGPLYATVTVTREYKRTLEALKQLDLNGNFANEPPDFDGIVSVGLVSGWSYSTNGSGYIRSYDPWNTDMDNVLYRGEEFYPNNVALSRTDASEIRAVAEASRDMLFTHNDLSWNANFATAFFEMSDGTVILKGVKLDDLPDDIRGEILEDMPEEYKDVRERASIT